MPAVGCSHDPRLSPGLEQPEHVPNQKPVNLYRGFGRLHVPDNLPGIVSQSFVTRPDLKIAQADFEQILFAIAPHLTSREKVVDCYFDPSTPDHAQLKVNMTPTPHGDGIAEFQKKQGVWVFIDCLYPN
jgi:hypothetical protein